jgi:molecular chaperone GrpE
MRGKKFDQVEDAIEAGEQFDEGEADQPEGEPGQAGPEAGGAEVEAGADEGALANAEQELAKHREAMLRMQAEMDNLRKRVARDAEKTRKFALERIMKDLLQVTDSMERGLEAADESATVESLREGQELTLKMFTKVLRDHDLEMIDPAGQPFDPDWHEAVTVVPSEEMDENTVVEVLQKGYRLHDRLIRPAMVMVSSKP